jgi:hypothetical protein
VEKPAHACRLTLARPPRAAQGLAVTTRKEDAMARGIGEPPENSPAAILFEVEYPISRDELAEAAAGAGASLDAINFFRSLPDRIYTSPNDVQREFGEGSARFGLFRTDVRHRGDLGKEAVETGANPTRHP